jgi:hypothetical protein
LNIQISVGNSLGRLWQKIVEWVSPPPPPIPWFTDDECRRLYDRQSAHLAGALDEHTWQDLLLPQYFREVSADASIFGQQVLYQRLRAGVAPTQRHEDVQQLRWLMADRARLAALHETFAPLREVDTEIADVLFKDAVLPSVPGWLGMLAGVPVLLLIAGLLLVYMPYTIAATCGLAGAIALLVMLVTMHMHYEATIERWNANIRALCALGTTVARLAAFDDAMCKWFHDHRGQARRMNRRLNRFPLPSQFLEKVRDYLDWFTLKKVRHYFKQIRQIDQAREFLRATYLQCGNVEANVVLARHLLEHARFCWAEPSSVKRISVQDAVHPLLPAATPLSLDTRHRGVFLTGQNGIGKSTLLRTVGINAVTARSVGFCYASQAVMPELSIHASMQSKDSLLQGESLYIAELRRARELLDWPFDGTSLYLIDEIFRGTNYLESVSAAAAYLHRLAERGIVIVSSHNTVLAPILADQYASCYLAVDENTRQLVLLQGVVAKTNGIGLLTELGFDEALRADASKVFEWLSQYLAQPVGGACVLGEARLKAVRPAPAANQAK